MSSFSFFLLLLSLSILSLVLLILNTFLTRIKINVAQRIFCLKVGLSMIGFAPIFFVVLKSMQIQTFTIEAPRLFIDTASAGTSVLLSQQPSQHWSFYPIAVYFFTVFLMLGRLAVAYRSTRKKLSTAVLAYVGSHRVLLSNEIYSPFSFGLLNSQVYFPENIFKRWSPREIEISLAHENFHILRADNFWKLYSLFVKILLFFAPWSSHLHRRMELEMEIYCDEQAALATNASVEEYGGLLLAMISREVSKFSLVTNMTDSNLRRRIVAMKSITKENKFATLLASWIIVLIGSIAVATTGGIVAKRDFFKISTKILFNGKLISAPILVVAEGADAIITQTSDDGVESVELGLVANNVSTPKIKGAIGLNMKLIYTVNGKAVVHTPQLIVAASEEAKVLFGDNGQNYEMQLKVDRQ